MKFKVLLVNDFVQLGGAEKVYLATFDVLESMDGVQVKKFDIETPARARRRLGSKAWNFEAASRFRQLLEAFSPDVIWMHNFHGYLSPSVLHEIRRYKRFRTCTAVMTAHDFHVLYQNPLLVDYSDGKITPVDFKTSPLQAIWHRSSNKSVAHNISRKLYWNAVNIFAPAVGIFDHFFAPSEYMAEALRVKGARSVSVLTNPVAVRNILPPRCLPFDETGLKLAYVGRIDPEKGVEEFIELLEQSSFYRVRSVTIIGSGTRVDFIKDRFAENIRQGTIRLEGYLQHDQLWERLQDVHAMVVPSIWCENAPLALVESAANGLPVLVHNIGSLRTFGNEIGNKIPFSFNLESFKQAMDRLDAWLSGERPQDLDLARYGEAAYSEAVRAFISSVRLKGTSFA